MMWRQPALLAAVVMGFGCAITAVPSGALAQPHQTSEAKPGGHTATAPISAATDDARGPRVVVTNAQQLMILVRSLIKAGDYATARRMIADWGPGDATYRHRVAFVEGLIQRQQGQYEAAIATFRSILADRPDFTFVRLDLTQTLYIAKQDDAAKYQAELLIASGVDDRVGGGLKSLVGAIDDRRPVRFRAYASLLPSSNINSGTDRQCVPIPLPGGEVVCAEVGEESKRKSGVGTLVGGEVLFRHPLSPKLSVIGSLAATGRYYPAIERADLDLDGAVGLERRFARGSLAFSLIAGRTLNDLEDTVGEYGLRLEGSRFVGTKGRVYGRLEVAKQDYIDFADRDGWRGEVSGFYDYFIDSTRFVRFIGGLAGERTDQDFYSFDEYSGGLGYNTELPFGITLYAQGTVARRTYEEPQPFLDLQEDTRYEGLATVTKRDFTFHGLAPQLTYSFTRNVSTVAFDDFTSHGIDLRLVKQF
ncbi:surface lipoprotein assembly modifier [Mangrovicella endophytica]|uniref:surface lipoprotein assembly modifier n=1 Tax=Mangrovicella endophytica TaxID=2066697 RepID=UPI000C9E9093|nr:surface lipoprotein assembly modifier [Mangrovicella endophytica]